MEEAPRHPFRYRDYRFYWIARFTSTIAQLSMVIVIGWQVYDIARRTMDVHEAAMQLGFIGLAQFLPLLVLTLVTGWTADRVDRRFIARLTALLELACAATLAWLTYSGHESLPALFTVAVLLGVSRAFAGPALGALAPNLVPPAVLPTAIAFSSISWQTGSVIGPALGGYLYAGTAWLPFAVSTVLFAICVTCLMFIRPLPRRAPIGIGAGNANPWAQMVEGLHYVRRNRLVLGAISLDLFAVLLGGATAMLPVYARDVLHVGAEGLGNLRGAPSFGSAAMAIFLSLRPLRTNVGVTMLVAVGVYGVATVLFGISHSMPLSLACLAALGAADMVSVYVRQSLIQLWTPDAMRGRVGAVSSLFISGSNELGETESGFLASLVGPVPAVVAGGIGAVLVAVSWSWWFPELKRARNFDPPKSFEENPLLEEKAA
jgi:MFS family permease